MNIIINSISNTVHKKEFPLAGLYAFLETNDVRDLRPPGSESCLRACQFGRGIDIFD